MTRVAVLTPAGTGAIATLAVVGPGAWDGVRAGFRPAKGTLPDSPVLHRYWLGKLGDDVGDEVIVSVKHLEPEPWVEVHCHGGRRVVRWAVEQVVRAGCVEVKWQELGKPTPVRGWAFDDRALEPLTRAATVRTASILLDQYHGAFASAIQAALSALDAGDTTAARSLLDRLARHAAVGRHLVAPWKVAIVGPPNAGKSSLVNAIAGFQRAVVSEVPGTTRDVVRTALAIDGWPVELIDTAGLRDAAEELEAAGIDRARRVAAAADLAVWVGDATDTAVIEPGVAPPPYGVITVANKIDVATRVAGTIELWPVSARTGSGVAELTALIAARLVPDGPPPGAAVPFTPALADLTEQATSAVAVGNAGLARATLLRCLH